MKTRPDFERAYYLALEERAAARADEIITITRNEAIDVPRGRPMVNSLFKLMAKEVPKRYGKPTEMVDGLPGDSRVEQRINAGGSAD